MAIILIESFDHFDENFMEDKYWVGNFGMIAGRVPYAAWSQAGRARFNGDRVLKFFDVPHSEIIVGGAVMSDSVDTASDEFWVLGCHDTHGTAYAGASLTFYRGHVAIKDSSGAIVGEGTTPIAAQDWNYVEAKVSVTPNGSAPFEVRLNGVTEMTGFGDFGDHATEYNDFDYLELSSLGFDFTSHDDIVVIATDNGGVYTDFIGDVVVTVGFPTADGHYHDWTPDTGTDLFSRVNEHLADGDASYVYDTVANDKATFPMTTIVSGPIIAAQLNLLVHKNDAGLRQIAPLIRQGGTDYTGPTFTLPSGYVFNSWILEQDPTNADWTFGTVNGDEFGIKLVA